MDYTLISNEVKALSNIPDELKARLQWVAWRVEDRDGKPAKIPVNHKTGINAKANDPSTWGTFDQAASFYEVHRGTGIAGIGFEFSSDDPYTGVDLDNCRDPETDELRYCARMLIGYVGSYSEVSPIKSGVHIIARGNWPEGGHRKAMPCGMVVEGYDRQRYFTMTGLHLEGTPATPEDRQKEIEALHSRLFPRSASPEGRTTQDEGGPDPAILDEEILSLAAHHDKFEPLWRGEWQGKGFPSQSEADLSLCSILAQHTQNPAQIDRLFRKSGLMRPKWDGRRGEKTYGQMTIGKALGSGHEADSSTKTTADQESTTSARKEERPHDPGASIASSAVPRFPTEVMAGAAGRFARSYAQYLETPEAFLCINYLSLLGHLISDKITLESEIRPQPRLYAVNLGESADTRKTTSINTVIKLVRDTVDPAEHNMIMGVGSAEGLAKALKTQKRAILILDELKALIQKMRIDTSVLLPCINTLFEVNHFHNITSNSRIIIDDAQLCLLGASTLDTYRNMFSAQFLDIGFVNRVFIVIGESQRKFAIPQPMPGDEKEFLRQDLRHILNFVQKIAANGRFSMPLHPDARQIFESWYLNLEQSVFC